MTELLNFFWIPYVITPKIDS
uniref:Uncharacterized protein n=1 Tax=Lepeophtheirus salmonis TaxID=72036 RepID=A0A0K2TSC8_LEPSM